MVNYQPIIQTLKISNDYRVDVLRLDLIHPDISGNKWFKLKNNLELAKAQNHDTILTFGGSFSNHIAATATACKLANIKSIGIIRGERTKELNLTLNKAQNEGMQLYFISREVYSKKEDLDFKQSLIQTYGKHYLVPEGGNNYEGIKGCTEILKSDWDYDYVLCACGTATTYLGLVASNKPDQKIIGFNVLKGKNDIVQRAQALVESFFPQTKTRIKGNEELNETTIKENCISDLFCFSGYAKCDLGLIEFKRKFERQYSVPLDYVYTNKLFFAAINLIERKKFKLGAKILIIHSGGQQANKGFEERYHLTPIL